MPFFETLEFLDDVQPHSAPLNMAIDEQLLLGIARPLLRVYRWERPAVSFGYFERYEEVAKDLDGREPVRRWTGGGVVPHGEDITYSLIIPAGLEFTKMAGAESYLAMHEEIARLLRDSGIAVSMAPTAAPKISTACFENAVQYDLVLDGRKIAGAAQRRTRTGLLQQGSIQLSGISPGDFGRRLSGRLAGRVLKKSINTEEMESAGRLAREKYATEKWMRKF